MGDLHFAFALPRLGVVLLRHLAGPAVAASGGASRGLRGGIVLALLRRQQVRAILALLVVVLVGFGLAEEHASVVADLLVSLRA